MKNPEDDLEYEIMEAFTSMKSDEEIGMPDVEHELAKLKARREKKSTYPLRKMAASIAAIIGVSGIALAMMTQQNLRNNPKTHEEKVTIENLEKELYHVCPKVKTPDLLGFFDAITDSYDIDAFNMARSNLHHQEIPEEAVAQSQIVDKARGYLRVDLRYHSPIWVECCYWKKTDGTLLVALNYCYDNDQDDSCYRKAHSCRVIFYTYDDVKKRLNPITPPINGYSDYANIRLPHRGRDILTADGHLLVWNDGEFTLSPQEALMLTPQIGGRFDFSPEAQKRFEAEFENDECRNSVFEVIGGGCSFYCGCEIGEQVASSTLSPQGNQNYEASNIHDLDHSTAWVEGVEGQGIGEWIEYTLPPNNPRITTICVANGLVRTENAWKENARVKTLYVEVNGNYLATLQLEDVYACQRFEVPTIGYADREDYEALQNKEPICIRFTICDTYPGTKYSDTAISEIFFDGIDVH